MEFLDVHKRRKRGYQRIDRLRSYWDTRCRVFEDFDSFPFVFPDAESLFEAMPERVTRYIVSRTRSKYAVLDLFAGIGGSIIHFALTESVQLAEAVDLSSRRINALIDNAECFGAYPVFPSFDASCKFLVHIGDALEVVAELKEQLSRLPERNCIDDSNAARILARRFLEFPQERRMVLLSPPWGGRVDKNSSDCIGLSDLPVDITEIVRSLLVTEMASIVLHLPRNIDIHQIVEWMRSICECSIDVEAVYYMLHERKLKFYLVYVEPSSTRRECSFLARNTD